MDSASNGFTDFVESTEGRSQVIGICIPTRRSKTVCGGYESRRKYRNAGDWLGAEKIYVLN